MPKCPFCGAEIIYLVVHESSFATHVYKVYSDGRWEWQYDDEGSKVYTAYCPECDEQIPLYGHIEDFLREKYVVLRSDDPEIKRKGNSVLFRGKVYKVEMESEGGALHLLHLKLVEDETLASIIKASLE